MRFSQTYYVHFRPNTFWQILNTLIEFYIQAFHVCNNLVIINESPKLVNKISLMSSQITRNDQGIYYKILAIDKDMVHTKVEIQC